MIAETRPLVVRVEAYGCSWWRLGSGYLLDSLHVVTVAHVVKDARSGSSGFADIAVRSIDRGVSRARIIGLDVDRDLALLELKSPLSWAPSSASPSSAPALSGLAFATKEPVEGDQAIAIGYPKGKPISVFQGHVVGLKRSGTIDGRSFSSLLQHDAVVTSGNSGGPVLDAEGHVIGMVESRYEGTDAQNFAVTGFQSQVASWLATPVVTSLPRCDGVPGIEVRSTHAEASGIAAAVGEWLLGRGRGYGALSGTALNSTSKADYDKTRSTVERSDIVLLPTVAWSTETTDGADVTYRQTEGDLCTVVEAHLTMSTTEGFWTVAEIAALAPKAC